MIHNYSGGIAGKGHEMKARQEFVDQSLADAFHDIYTNFLSIDEMDEVIDGKDLWMGKDEVIQRFNGTFHSSEAATTAKSKKKGRPRKES